MLLLAVATAAARVSECGALSCATEHRVPILDYGNRYVLRATGRERERER